ncbi:MAG: YdbH domain-containing protein, partial [Candidatus Didemnitutus sp.]|nr:YdbH domain-containing protein [Candidatus Didemnitutus sp.]
TVTQSHLDLTRWETLLQQFAPMPAGVWREVGTVSATAELHAKVGAKPGEDFKVWGTVHASAPGLLAEITGSYDSPSGVAQFEVTRSELDLARWQNVVQKLAPLPGGVWQMEGKVSATAAGSYAAEQVSARAQVQLREGRFVHPEGMPVASGVTAEFNFIDAVALISEPGVVRVREIDAGEIKATNFEAEIALAGADELRVSRVTMEAMGGRVAVEPFVLFPQRDDIEATLLVDGLVVEQLLALTKDLPAKATGRVDGRLPVHYNSSGVRLGTGWLELKRGAPAELQFNSYGLLTAGVAPKHPSYATLKKIETGLLRLKLTELRLDIRPPQSPAGRSATLRVAGVPVDPELQAPVHLDLNVNGPIEHLLNLGMDSRIKFATGL